MRALAKVIMGGRWQAAIFAFIGLPIISPAAVSLVTLRRGAFDGAWIMLALLAPALIWSAMGLVWWAFLLTTLMASALVYVAALVLRVYQSWPLTIVFVSLVSIIGAYVITISVDLRADMLAMAEHMDMGEIDKVDFQKTVDSLLAQNVAVPIIGLSSAIGVTLSLTLARWWQAVLYNPGGFREEFHSIRLDLKLVALCAAVGLVFMQAPNGGSGILVVLLPLFFAGLGFAHWWFAKKQLPYGVWVLYFSLFLSLWVFAAVVALGLLDSLLDLRKRIESTN